MKHSLVSTLTLLGVLVALVLGCGAPKPQVQAPSTPEESYIEPSSLGEYDMPGPRERIGLNSRVDSDFYNGASLTFYSDDHATQKIKLNGSTGAVSAASVSATGAVSGSSGAFPALTVNGAGITMDSMVFTYTTPITISGVLTNVRLLYYQAP